MLSSNFSEHRGLAENLWGFLCCSLCVLKCTGLLIPWDPQHLLEQVSVNLVSVVCYFCTRGSVAQMSECTLPLPENCERFVEGISACRSLSVYVVCGVHGGANHVLDVILSTFWNFSTGSGSFPYFVSVVGLLEDKNCLSGRGKLGSLFQPTLTVSGVLLAWMSLFLLD